MSKPSRNDPCPCGSGKKYKKCCANKILGTRRVSVHSQGVTSSLFQGAASNAAKSLKGRVSFSQGDKPAIPKKEEDEKEPT